MAKRAEPRLIIVDGSLESLVASMLVDPPDQSIAWFVGGSPEEVELRRTAARIQADLLGLGEIREVSDGADFWADLPGGFGEAGLLLAAVTEAVRDGISRVMWPKQVAGDLDAMLDAADRALLIQRVGLIEQQRASTPDLRIDTPLIDLSDQQVAELVVDLDAPAWASWWALPDAIDLAAAQAERVRWSEKVIQAGGERLLTRQRRFDAA